MRSRWFILLGLVIVAAFSALAGCDGGKKHSSPKTTGSENGGTLVTLAAAPPAGSPDPQINYSRQEWQLLILTHDGLVGFKRGSGDDGTTLVPDLATAIPKPLDRGTTYVFRLRKGIKFANGKQLEASDVTFTFERLFKLRRSPNARTWYSVIAGAQACLRAPKRCDLSRGVVADDATRTVTFHLTRPDPEFLYKLAVPFAFILPNGTPTEVQLIPPAGTGPYEFTGFNPDQIKLTRNVHFKEWSKEAQPAGNPDTIVQRFGSTVDSEVTQIEADEADWMTDPIPPDRLRAFQGTRYANAAHVNPQAATAFFAFNVHAPPFDNLKARRAVNFAVDRSVLVDLYGGPDVASPTCQVLPPGLPGYEPYCPYTKNPSGGTWTAPNLGRARRLLAASGTSGASVTVATDSMDTHRALGVYLVQVLNRLGYRSRLLVLPPGLATARCAKVQVCWSSWQADYPSASDFFEIPLGCGSSANISRFCDPAIEARVAQAVRKGATDSDAAEKQWAAIDRTVTNRAPWVAVFNPSAVDFISRRVADYEFSPQWGFLLGQASVQKLKVLSE